MGKKLIITEKPSVARDFARVLGVDGRGNGYIENNEYVISWCVGHLVEMLYPESYDERYKKWRLEDLPFLPKEYKYGVIDSVKQQYETVHGLLHRADIDVCYWAGDSGKEGQTIEENIRNFGGVREGMTELRVWIDSQTDDEIKRGIREAKPMSDYANLGFSGIMRTIEDYALGINFSRALSVKYGRLINDAAATNSYTAIAVGRVMTCVLGMVVRREREIRDFVETPFYKVNGKFTDAEIIGEWKAVEGSKYFDSPLLYKENGFKKEETAQVLIDSLSGKEAVLKQLDKVPSKKKAPLLFNLSELQAECAKLFKISPDETLEVAQFLYEHKLTTYPRTDARVLTTAVSKEITKNINGLSRVEFAKSHVEYIQQNKSYAGLEKTQYVDDSKVTDHYAIIPTGVTNGVNNLSPLQAKVYELIVRRFLAIFYPPAEYMNVKVTIGIQCEDKEEQFFINQKTLMKPGYLLVSPAYKNPDEKNEDKDSEEDQNLDQKKKAALEAFIQSAQVGQKVDCLGFEMKEGKTQPPKRYTTGTMVLAMENAGNLIEEEELRAQIKNSGIGTSATRAEIIKKLITIGYLNVNNKTQILSPRPIGEMIYEVVFLSAPSLLNPEMTASWERGLDGITKGTVQMGSYRVQLEDYIRKTTLAMAESNLTEQIKDNIKSFLSGDARGSAAIHKIGVTCPACGGELSTTSFGFGCSNYRNTEHPCKFAMSGEIAGRKISEVEFKDLIEKGTTEVLSGFVSTKKRPFKAKLKLIRNDQPEMNTNGQNADGKKFSVVFDFDGIAPDTLEDVVCPLCKGKIEITGFGYRCENAPRGGSLVGSSESGISSEGYGENNTSEGPKHFNLGKILGKEINKAQVKELLTNGKTATIRGFKSNKSKSKFDACLKLDENYNVVFDFEEVEEKVINNVKCPNCGGEIVKSRFGFRCRNFVRPAEGESMPEGGCNFSIGTICQKELTEAHCKDLLQNGITKTITGFKSKAGKNFSGRLELDRDENGKVKGLKFNFEATEDQYLPDVKCPICEKPLIMHKDGCRCINYGREEGKCSFYIGKIAGVTLSKEQLLQLLSTGHTDEIDGFLSKKGMFFAAKLKLDENHRASFDFPQRGDQATASGQNQGVEQTVSSGQIQRAEQAAPSGQMQGAAQDISANQTQSAEDDWFTYMASTESANGSLEEDDQSFEMDNLNITSGKASSSDSSDEDDFGLPFK